MRKQKLFFKNMFKNIIKNQLQLIMVILLMFLSSFVFTLTDSSTQRLRLSRTEFVEKSNLHDAIISFQGSSYNFQENDEFRTITNNELRNEMILNYLKNSLDRNNSKFRFDFDRTEARTFSLSTGKTLKVINLEPEKTVDTFVVTAGMSIDMWNSYVNSQNDLSKRWVYVSESFARENNIQINDIIRLNDDGFGTSILVRDSEINTVDLSGYENLDINTWIPNSRFSTMNWFQVVGYGSGADFMAPIVSETSPLPNPQNEGLLYVNPKNFGWQRSYLENSFNQNIIDKMREVIEDTRSYIINFTDTQTQGLETLRAVSDQDREVYYSIKFLEPGVNIDVASKELNKILTNLEYGKEFGLTSSYQPGTTGNNKLVYSINDSDYTFYLRANMFSKIILFFQLIMYISTSIIVAIGVWILVIILKNNIQKTFGQNGVLISLGYRKNELIISNCLYPIIISVIGGITGYLLALPFQILVVNIFSNFFTIQFSDPDFSIVGLFGLVFGLFIFLLLVTLITYWIMFNKYSPLQMINYENITTTSNFKIKFKKLLTKRKTFNARFKGAILSSSVSKFITITSVMLISSMIISVGIIAPNVLTNYTNFLYKDNEFDNKIEYQAPLHNLPTTFYKTYNPYSDSVEVTADAQDLLDMYLQNEISANIYMPKNDVGSLTDLNYRNLNKDFLTNLDLTLDVGEGNTGIDINALKGTIISSVWSDYRTFRLDHYVDKQRFLDVIASPESLKDRLEDIENLRLFYLRYRNTIGLNIRRPEYFSENNIFFNSENEAFVTNRELESLGVTGGNPFPVLANSGRIQNDSILTNSFFDELESSNEQFWYLSTARYATQIYNWIRAFFIDNLQQGFLQGIYVSSPESLRRIMSESFKNDDAQFNALFNVIPYNAKTDDIGIFMDAIYNNIAFKIYGIDSDNQNQTLLNSNGVDLKGKLFEDSDNMIINSSMARLLNLRVGDTIDAEHIYQALAINGEEVDPLSWDASELSAVSSDGTTNQGELYSRSLFSETERGWRNNQISADDFIFNSQIDYNSETMTSPTVMSDLANSGTASLQRFSTNKSYNIVGISRQFGDAKAWVQNETIKQVAQYDKSEAVLFQVFLKEWANPRNYQASELLTLFVNNISDWKTTDTSLYPQKLADFKNWANQNEEQQKILKLFQAQYPIFNYKTSMDDSFVDISKGVTASQQFGDFSSFGLNGGTTNSQSLTGFQMAAISNALQIETALQIQQRVFTNLKIVVYYVTATLLVLSLIIIMLIVNLVIIKYQKIIAVLKVLGYKNSYILNIFVGMYIPVVLFTTILGYIFGVLVMMSISNAAIGSGLVLPFFPLTWWYPIVTLLVVWIIYIASSITSWEILKRIRLLLAVQEG